MTLKTFLKAGLLCLTSVGVLSAQQPEDRLIIADGVNCREQPSPNATVVLSLRLGDRIKTPIVRLENGDSWFQVDERIPAGLGPQRSLRGNCFVNGALTAGYSASDPTPALIAVADRALKREESTFEDLVAVANLFEGEQFSQAVSASGLLQTWRFRVIDSAVGKRQDERNPLTTAWILAHRGPLTQSFFSGRWYVPPAVFWDLYSKYEGKPEADEIAWAAAQAPIFTDECFAECHLEITGKTFRQYWTKFPRGIHTAEAVMKALERVEYAGRFCILMTAGKIHHGDTGTLTADLRTSLAPVSAPGKDDLLRRLAELDQNCGAAAPTSLTVRGAIPGLLRALGLGFSITGKSLAALGDEAAPAVLEVVRSDKDYNRVDDGMRTLTLMIDGSSARPVSMQTREEIRRTAQQRLAGTQYFTTLTNAIDLALALNDADLRRTVESLAVDANAVRQRGIEDPDLVSHVQRRATRALAGN
jgi:hypothetical protein